jgi:F-type H+-transporting ATPase subunit c
MKKFVAPLLVFVTCLLAPVIAMAAPAAAAGGGADKSVVAIAMALTISIAALGGALGQGRAAAAALEGICRNPNARDAVFVPMLLGLAFIESLVIFALVIDFIMMGF